jgi:pyruvate dehydrogenase E1 component
MIPFFVYYSMFGFQRIGDLAWAAGDMQARGFLLGGTSGRTTLNGEGLQHEDGHSHILAGTIPNCISYDPTFAHEVAVIMQHGLKRMVEKQENVFYYLTLLNENYPMPGLKAGTEEQIIKGMYLLEEGAKKTPRVNLLGSGSILRESQFAKQLLEDDWGVAANVWSCPSFNELAREGQDVERWNMLHPADTAKKSYFEQSLEGTEGPIVVSTDYMRTYAEQVRAFVPKGRSYKVLGTDGYGRSDTRAKLREFFEVERRIYGAVYTRILACVACVLSPTLQVTLATDDSVVEPDLDLPYVDDAASGRCDGQDMGADRASQRPGPAAPEGSGGRFGTGRARCGPGGRGWRPWSRTAHAALPG